eukprot:SAG11_NODE_1920_length_4069_cov_3.001511_5_plen_323_part_00
MSIRSLARAPLVGNVSQESWRFAQRRTRLRRQWSGCLEKPFSALTRRRAQTFAPGRCASLDRTNFPLLKLTQMSMGVASVTVLDSRLSAVVFVVVKWQRNNPTALIQLSTADFACLLRIRVGARWTCGPPSPVPPGLRKLLEDPNIKKAGVGVQNDLNGCACLSIWAPSSAPILHADGAPSRSCLRARTCVTRQSLHDSFGASKVGACAVKLTSSHLTERTAPAQPKAGAREDQAAATRRPRPGGCGGVAAGAGGDHQPPGAGRDLFAFSAPQGEKGAHADLVRPPAPPPPPPHPLARATAALVARTFLDLAWHTLAAPPSI